MVELLDLSAELVQTIFQNVEPVDLASLARTCGSLHRFINPNQLLWKEIFLQHYDYRSNDQGGEVDWTSLLRRYVETAKIMQSDKIRLKRDNFSTVAKTTLNMAMAVGKRPEYSHNVLLLDELYKPQENIDIFLSSSSLFMESDDEGKIPRVDEHERQLSAKLNVHYGIPLRRRTLGPPSKTHQYARARVYDLRHYTEKTMWGPFKADGSGQVDWEKVEAIMIDLAHNLEKYTLKPCGHFEFSWHDNFYGCAADSYESTPLATAFDASPVSDEVLVLLAQTLPGASPMSDAPLLSLDDRDPYGVTGTWRRVVCFLDYTDLHYFNFVGDQPPPDTPRPPLDKLEAIRLITVKIRVTKIDPPGENDGQDYPVVHFSGKSRSLHYSWDQNASSRIRGTVRQTPEGEIRWTTFSVFHGEERWRSECIQVGGIRSARGTLGTWFDKDFNEAGPAGPTAFWKISDDIVEKPRLPMLHLDDLDSEEDSDEEENVDEEDDEVDEDGDGEEQVIIEEVLEEWFEVIEEGMNA